MRRILIQIHEQTYRALKIRALREKRSIAAIVRESISQYTGPSVRRRSVEDFTFVGSGRAASDRRQRVSENHDGAFAAAILSRRRASRK